jgi:hypothetical protein
MTDETTEVRLTAEERDLLADVLDSDYRALKEQINKAEDRTFHAELKVREATLLAILRKVRPEP